MAESTGSRPRGTLEQRFWAKVDHSGGPDACWPWMGNRLPKGYGQIRVKRGERWVNAHANRVALELRLGRELEPDELSCHSCDNPPCVNPTHLFPGSSRENTADMDQKGRRVTPQLHGAANGRAVLTVETATEIRRLHGEGLGYWRLARLFGVGRTTVARVVRGEAWVKED